MNIDYLVNMANRIGDFFQNMPDKNEARHDIAAHLKKYWEPRMREALIENIDQPATDGLHGIVREAVKEHLDMLTPSRR